MAEGCGARASLIEEVERVNERQKQLLPDRIKARFGLDLSGRSIGVWGLSFKPDTDDMRQAPSLVIVPALLELGAQVRVYDPKALNEARKYLGEADRLEYVDKKHEALVGADALVLLTEWREFRKPDFEWMKELMKTPVIFDGRNQYNHEQLARMGFEYRAIGLPPPHDSGLLP
jgi:UDPglucose 6-dehydrogenase